MENVTLPKCRKCWAMPVYAKEDIVPEHPSYAIHCSNPDCYNDTHWQNSTVAAEEVWQNNPCHYERGGQGDPSDDTSVSYA